MFQTNIILVSQVLCVCYANWVSEWMAPVQDEFGTVKDLNARMNYDADLKKYEDQELKLPKQELPMMLRSHEDNKDGKESHVSSATLQAKLETTLARAQVLAASLQEQIASLTEKEMALKEVIANGRSGVSVVTVYTLLHTPRSYLIRDGTWTSCQGMLQSGDSHGSFGPKCVGIEANSMPDPCVFNSVTKYETLPVRRRNLYTEDDYLCLKNSFNTTIEHYLSVPRHVVNTTCTNGVVRSLEGNIAECGLRVLSEYIYYPSAAARVPREYCDPAPSGACRLLAAWHLSNTTIENFEFLKDEPNFKNYFIKNE